VIDTSRLRFLGRTGLLALRDARASVVGVGGGGSHVAQQLAYLAVGTLNLVDADSLERSNINRVVGATYSDIGRKKAVTLAARFSGLGGEVVPIVERAEARHARLVVESSDIVVGAIDTYRARQNLERTCRAALIPYVDIGLKIVVDESGVTAVGGQVVTSLPGGPCLECMKIITAESLAADREEYISGSPEQQVVSMNGLLASQAVNTVLSLITGFGGPYRPPVYLTYDGLLHEMRPHPLYPDSEPCSHYVVADAGHRFMLPPRKALHWATHTTIS